MRKFHLLLIIFTISHVAMGQVTEQVANQSDTIPFELTSHNNLSIKAVLNELDTVKLMFHTAASSVTLIKESTKNLTSIIWEEDQEVESWGGSSSARFSTNNSLEVSGLNWDSLAIWETENSGPTTDGKFGPNLFAGKALEIDFNQSIIIAYETLPTKTAAYQRTPLIFKDGFMFIEGTSTINGVDHPNNYLIHTGYGGTILYDDEFVANSKISDHIEITAEKELKDSYGNVLKTKKGKLPQFAIGDIVFEDIPVGFFEGSIGRQKMSVVGGDLLKRFNLIVDANREYIYLKPNHLKDASYSEI